MLAAALIWTLSLGAGFLPAAGSAAEDQDAGGNADSLRAATQNPISSLISLPFKFSFDNGAENGDADFLFIQPVIPVSVGDWNLVNRVILPVVDAPGGVSGLAAIPNPTTGGRRFGLGDINYSLFLNPVETTLPFIWGVGGSLTAPTATSDVLGSGKWSGGPTGVVLVQPSWGTYGALVRQIWSFAGDSDRGDVSQLLVQPFLNYNLADGWYLITDMSWTANWKASASNQWTLPVGGGAGKIFKIGGQAMNARVESYYNAVRPRGAPTWTIGFTVQFLFPK